MIKKEHRSNPFLLLIGIVGICAAIAIGGYNALTISVAVFIICLAFYVRSLYSYLSIHVPGSDGLKVVINGTRSKNINDFIFRLESEMDRVKH